MSTYAILFMPYFLRAWITATPTSLKTQKPPAESRRAWCNPAIGTNAFSTFLPILSRPFTTMSSAASVEPTTCSVASNTPRNDGVSPLSRGMLLHCFDAIFTNSTYSCS